MTERCTNHPDHEYNPEEFGAAEITIVRTEFVQYEDGDRVERIPEILKLCPKCFIESGLQFYTGDFAPIGFLRKPTEEDRIKHKELFEYEQAALNSGKYGEF